ncbi:N-formylglutamate amidohydrolase [Kordiimonas laminariae]|uniref:N-formylglutamate amidohydrolase n=1 Tax=Kordiimonas laminariae TaxID=2917717 RepID=UPI001FF577B2|nr:N-formylglutamate amidohydrolase [Kordiimonas laminariae]MCK0068369.1 N-formylglutamate amidohydrolase [Kordiimonas laminariae]
MTVAAYAPEIINPDATENLVILCEHASNHIPADLNNLGLPAEELKRHIAWDIGAEAVTRKMCEMMGVSAVVAKASRLVLDANREPDHNTLIPLESDGTLIPGNQNLSVEDIQNRKEAFYDPFHQAADAVIERHLEAGVNPIVIGMHSFTPHMDSFDRPWQIGFLWNKDQRLAQAMIGLLERETDLTIGDNEPYSGQDLYYTMQRHGADRGLPQTTIEIRQDLLADDNMVTQWAALLAECLDECMGRADLMKREYF